MKFPSMYFDRSRRAFLRSTGIAAGLVPLLGTERALRAAPFPRRLLVIGSANAWVHDTFLPAGPAANLSTLTLPEGTRPLEKHKADINLIAGLEYRNYKAFYPASVDYVDCHHSLPHILTGKVGVMGKFSSSRPQDGVAGYRPAGGGVSLDQFYADELAAAGVKLPFPVLTLGVQDESCCEPTLVQMSWRGPDQPNAVENSPYKLFSRLFASLGGAPSDLERLKKERTSVLDFVGRSLDRYKQTLGTEDRLRIEQHLATVRKLEANVQALSGAACSKPTLGTAIDVASNANLPTLFSAQLDNLTAAMACDLTRSATLWMGSGGGIGFPSWLNNPDFNGPPLAGNAGDNRNHHDLAHASDTNAEARRIKTILESWIMQQFAGLLDRFKAVKEGSGTMLDNTLILWVNNMGTGTHSWRHNVWITAGRGGGGFPAGKYVPAGEWAQKGLMGACVPQNGVLTAAANALLDRQASSFGDAQFGGELPGLRG